MDFRARPQATRYNENTVTGLCLSGSDGKKKPRKEKRGNKEQRN